MILFRKISCLNTVVLFLFFICQFFISGNTSAQSHHQNDSTTVYLKPVKKYNKKFFRKIKRKVELLPRVQRLDSLLKYNTLSQEEDSVNFYKYLEYKSRQNKLYKSVYDAVIVVPAIADFTVKPIRKQPDPYKKYEGYNIASIEVIVLDPFGTNVDSPESPNSTYYSGLSRAGNSFHIRTNKQLIKSLLLFKRGDKVEKFRLKDSERILRSTPFIRDSRIKIIELEDSHEVVVQVVVQDIWSFYIDADPDYPLRASYGEKNLMGLGQEINFRDVYQITTPYRNARSIFYRAPPIGRSFIISTFNYTFDPDNVQKTFMISRGLFSLVTKWAYGFQYTRSDLVTTLVNPADTIKFMVPVTFNLYDFWLTRSISLKKTRDVDDQENSVLLSTRYLQQDYLEKIPIQYDSSLAMADQKYIMASVSFSKRYYKKDLFFYKLGRVEDIPLGRLISFVGGYNNRQYHNYTYAAVKYFKAIMPNHWYYGFSVQAGNQFYENAPAKPVIAFDFNFVSPLFRVNNWLIRNYTYMQVIQATNLFVGEYSNLNDRNFFFGNSAGPYKNNGKLLFSNQTAITTPLRVIGFRFVPVIFIANGFHSHQSGGFDWTRPYQAYGLNCYVRNDRLVSGTFNFGVALYYLHDNNPDFDPSLNPPGSFNDNTFFGFAPDRPSEVGFK